MPPPTPDAIAGELTNENEKPTFKEYIFKVASRCNMGCDYCFMYEHVDQSWRSQPRFMDRETLAWAAARIAEHTAGGDESIRVIFHGGEPLLAERNDPDFYPWATAVLNELVGERVKFGMQTNATLVDEALIEKMAGLNISMGVSLDGPAAINDAHRIFKNGAGTYAETARGIRLLAAYERVHRKGTYAGLLNVINPDSNPLHVYATLRQGDFGAPNIDFLLPLAHHDMPPPGYTDDRSRTPYADWLIPIFDQYVRQDRHKIRLFDSILALALGNTTNVEYMGLNGPRNIVVETNGEIQAPDALKTVAEGEPSLGLNVVDNTFDEAMRHPKIVFRRLGFAALARACQECDLVTICGGGYQGHRYSEANGYQNPSVYHPDLVKLLTYIRDYVDAALRKAALDSLGGDSYRDYLASNPGNRDLTRHAMTAR